VDTILVGGYRLESFSLDVLQYPNGWSADSATYAPEAFLEFTRADTADGGGVAQGVMFSPDTLDLVFPETEIGTVRIFGSFLDKRGRFGLWPEIDGQGIPVLQARVTVTRQGRTVYSRRTKFTFWQGD
jgi:hypothetical protein